MKPPKECLYCNGKNPDCGFCDNGKPLDSASDWDRTWGRIFMKNQTGTNQ